MGDRRVAEVIRDFGHLPHSREPKTARLGAAWHGVARRGRAGVHLKKRTASAGLVVRGCLISS